MKSGFDFADAAVAGRTGPGPGEGRVVIGRRFDAAGRADGAALAALAAATAVEPESEGGVTTKGANAEAATLDPEVEDPWLAEIAGCEEAARTFLKTTTLTTPTTATVARASARSASQGRRAGSVAPDPVTGDARVSAGADRAAEAGRGASGWSTLPMG